MLVYLVMLQEDSYKPGEIYKAKLDGLDDDAAATMGLAVDLINSLVEYGVRTNRLANRAMGIRGQSVIYNAIFDVSKKTGMRLAAKLFCKCR